MKGKFEIKKYILVIIAALALAGVTYINNKVFIVSFEQLLYGAMKMKGAGASTFWYGFIYIVVSFIIICPIVMFPAIDLGKKIIIKIRNKDIQLYPIKNVKRYGSILLVVSLISLLYVFKFFPYIRRMVFDHGTVFEDYYVDSSKIDISFPDEKRNLIYIFVESLESSNVSRENGGLFDKSVIPNLEQMAIDNTNFSGNNKVGGGYQSYGTNWTAAAMIAQTSGIPLKVTFNDLTNNSLNFRNVTTIGDILSNNGYNNYLFIGSDANFGGRRGYFANHNYAIYDYYSAIEQGFIPKDYYEWWGFEDYKLFDYAKVLLEDISDNDRPFNFTLLTADTHFTDGYLDKKCSEEFKDPYANSFYCSDNMIYEFVEWVREQDFYKDTTIVIVGDHFTMQDGFYKDTDYDKRSIYNVFINTGIDKEFKNKNRIFNMMDMFPTTLASVGAKIKGDRLGLGTNLFSDLDTISEMIGMDEFNEEMMKGSNYYYNHIR